MSSDFKLAMHSRNTIDELRCLARLEPWFYALCDLRSIGAPGTLVSVMAYK